MLLNEQDSYKIYLDSFYSYKTYGGLLAGLPNEKLNQRLLDRIPNNIERTLGRCKIHIRAPEIELKKSKIPYLPRWINAARLHSKAINSKSDGSMLILVWFSNTLPISAEGELHQVLDEIDWKEEAEDFYF